MNKVSILLLVLAVSIVTGCGELSDAWDPDPDERQSHQTNSAGGDVIIAEDGSTIVVEADPPATPEEPAAVE